MSGNGGCSVSVVLNVVVVLVCWLIVLNVLLRLKCVVMNCGCVVIVVWKCVIVLLVCFIVFSVIVRLLCVFVCLGWSLSV